MDSFIEDLDALRELNETDSEVLILCLLREKMKRMHIRKYEILSNAVGKVIKRKQARR